MPAGRRAGDLARKGCVLIPFLLLPAPAAGAAGELQV